MKLATKMRPGTPFFSSCCFHPGNEPASSATTPPPIIATEIRAADTSSGGRDEIITSFEMAIPVDWQKAAKMPSQIPSRIRPSWRPDRSLARVRSRITMLIPASVSAIASRCTICSASASRNQPKMAEKGGVSVVSTSALRGPRIWMLRK